MSSPIKLMRADEAQRSKGQEGSWLRRLVDVLGVVLNFGVLLSLIMLGLTLKGHLNSAKHYDGMQPVPEYVRVIMDDLAAVKVRLTHYEEGLMRLAGTAETIAEKNAILVDLQGRQMQLLQRYLALVRDENPAKHARELAAINAEVKKLKARIDAALAELKARPRLPERPRLGVEIGDNMSPRSEKEPILP